MAASTRKATGEATAPRRTRKAAPKATATPEAKGTAKAAPAKGKGTPKATAPKAAPVGAPAGWHPSPHTPGKFLTLARKLKGSPLVVDIFDRSVATAAEAKGLPKGPEGRYLVVAYGPGTVPPVAAFDAWNAAYTHSMVLGGAPLAASVAPGLPHGPERDAALAATAEARAAGLPLPRVGQAAPKAPAKRSGTRKGQAPKATPKATPKGRKAGQ